MLGCTALRPDEGESVDPLAEGPCALVLSDEPMSDVFWTKLYAGHYSAVSRWFRKLRAAPAKVDCILGVVHVSGGTHWAAVFVDLCCH